MIQLEQADTVKGLAYARSLVSLASKLLRQLPPSQQWLSQEFVADGSVVHVEDVERQARLLRAKTLLRKLGETENLPKQEDVLRSLLSHGKNGRCRS